MMNMINQPTQLIVNNRSILTKTCLTLLLITSLLPNSIRAQSVKSITGKVKVKDFGSIGWVMVTLPGGNLETPEGRRKAIKTNRSGYFKIEVSADTEALEFRYLGLKSVTVQIPDNNVVNVTMEEDPDYEFETFMVSHKLVEKDGTYFLKGYVTRKEDGQSLPHIYVDIKKHKIYAGTSLDGDFDIKVPEKFGEVSFSFLGFRPTTLPYGLK